MKKAGCVSQSQSPERTASTSAENAMTPSRYPQGWDAACVQECCGTTSNSPMRKPLPRTMRRTRRRRDRVPSQRGGGTNRLDCRSYAWANASTRASSPGSPTTDRLSAGMPSAPMPAGTDTSGSPSQLP